MPATTFPVPANLIAPTIDERKSVQDWFFSNSDEDANGCWNWNKSKLNSGYGQVTVRSLGGKHLAHRLCYRFTRGEIPEGMMVMHSCDNRTCVNPKHLSIGTAAMNQRDSWLKGRRTPIADKHKVRGDKHGRAVLKEADVVEIKRMIKANESLKTIAERFDVGKSTISMIKNGTNWSHVTID
jgi:hypothetical protein